MVSTHNHAKNPSVQFFFFLQIYVVTHVCFLFVLTGWNILDSYLRPLTSTAIADESIPNKEPKDVEDRDFKLENNTSVSLCSVPEAVVLVTSSLCLWG